MLGAESGVIKVMIDGRSVAYRTTSGNWMGVELVPLEAVQQIEIIRGPASALYGADAFLVGIAGAGGGLPPDLRVAIANAIEEFLRAYAPVTMARLVLLPTSAGTCTAIPTSQDPQNECADAGAARVMCVVSSVAVQGAATPAVKVPPVPLWIGITMEVTRAKSLLVATVALPPFGIAIVSVIVVPFAAGGGNIIFAQ